ncbi:MAG TPA: PspC domain-containing protein [Candidatus Saccharimonadales bacterium]|nr:PspC domain-containing protein [Candidatus Saccharimonadales bacterium]
MNEITKIHLGRQAYTISVDAHRELEGYISAISKQVKDTEVINEVELRMSELLSEHGISDGKVILSDDIAYLKSQLGSPADFVDDSTESQKDLPDTKRLFRDTDNAIIAGVAAGLARYFGFDVLLVRILFVIFTFVTAGWGILLYILLWLLVPEAKTSSERLQMAGKPVTIQSLKEVVEHADVKGTARRANSALADPINAMFRFILRVVGIAFVVLGLGGLLGLIAGGTYFTMQHTAWTQNNIFPIGLRENILLWIVFAFIGLVCVFIVLFGIAFLRHRWPIKAWVTGVLVGLIFIGLAIGGALTADVYPNVHDTYLKNTHTALRVMPPFSSLSIVSGGAIDNNINFVQSDKYMIAFNYYDHPNIAAVKASVNKGVLLIDTSNFGWVRSCSTPCFPNAYRLNITVYAPDVLQLEGQATPGIPIVPPASPINE